MMFFHHKETFYYCFSMTYAPFPDFAYKSGVAAAIIGIISCICKE